MNRLPFRLAIRSAASTHGRSRATYGVGASPIAPARSAKALASTTAPASASVAPFHAGRPSPVAQQRVERGEHAALDDLGHPFSRAPAVGWEAVRRSFEEAWPRSEEFKVTVNESVQVRVGQGGAVVLATTPVRQKVRGGAAMGYTALATFAFERRNGRWLRVRNHVSRVPQQ